MNNRDKLKQIIKKLVLKEIANNTFGTPDDKTDVDGLKAVEKVVGKEGRSIDSVGTGKSVGDSPKHNIQFIKKSPDCYDVVSVTNDSERKTAKNLKLDDAVKFAKDHASDSEKSYTEKARAKSLNSGPAEKKKKDSVKVDDKMEETKEDTQKDIADKNDKATETSNEKEFDSVTGELSGPMGGELVDKIEKIIDRVIKNKADAKTPYLKFDSDMESPDKLTTKLSDTPALKEKKK